MSHRSRFTPGAAAGRVAGLALVGILAFGTNAAAGQDQPPSTDPPPAVAPVVAATSVVTLPLFGAPLVVDINTDPGGNLVDVALNQPGDFTATTVKPNKVVFVSEAEGVRVRVKAKHGGERIDARAADLADVSGPGQWSGDVFENGQATTVDFTVGTREDGSPDITGVTVTSPLEFTIGETEYDSGDKHGGDSARASVTIRFSESGQTRTLRIKVSAHTGEEHTSAKLSVGLSRVKGPEVPDGEAVGAHTWTGMLCDGTTATVGYTILEDGSIADVTAAPEGAEVRSEEHHAKVRFATGESVRIRAFEHDGEVKVGARERIRCDAADPMINIPIDPDADTGDGDHRRDRDGWGDHDGWWGDRGDDGGRDGDGWRDRGDGSGDDGGRDGDRGHHRHDYGDD
ncbi:MAG: hypothetical protein ACRDZZ_14095 [Ilumatobacteraceae bacterium]